MMPFNFRGPMLLALTLVGVPLPQSQIVGQASRYAVERDWFTDAFEDLIRLGTVRDPDPMTRPLSLLTIQRTLGEVSREDLSPSVSELVDRLELALEERMGGSLTFDGGLGAGASSYSLREPLREQDSTYSSPTVDVAATAHIGRIVATSNLSIDQRYRSDPDYGGRRDSPIPGRWRNSYIRVGFDDGEAVFGAVARNWGHPRIAGFVISDEPYDYDHLYIRFDNGMVSIEALGAQLDDLGRPDDGPVTNRFYSAHRLMLRPSPSLRLSFTQATLWAGVGRSIEPWFLNPLKLSSSTADDELTEDQNTLYSVESWSRLPWGWTVTAGIFVDDLASFFGTSFAPDRGGLKIVVDVPLGRTALQVHATAVSSLTYRSPSGPAETVTRLGVGLGRNHADYYEVAASLLSLPTSSVRIEPGIALLRQGEGRINSDFPPNLGAGQPTIFIGTIATTLRVGTDFRLRFLDDQFSVHGDIGLHLVDNAEHSLGVSESDFVWRIAVEISDIWRFD